MKRGVTYLSSSAYRRHKLRKRLSPLFLSAVKYIFGLICMFFVVWGLGALTLRALDVEYKMQQEINHEHLWANGGHNVSE